MKTKKMKSEISHSERSEITSAKTKRLTLNKSLDLFVNHLSARKLASSSVQAYRGDIKIFQAYMKKNSYKVYVDQINKIDISNYQNHLLSSSYKMTTIDRKYDSLQLFFRFLTDINAISENPLKNFVFKRSKGAYDKEEDHTINFLEMDQINEIIAFAKSSTSLHKYRDVAILELLRTTGCRRDTVLNINWSDVNFAKSEIKLNHQKTNNRVVIKMSKSLNDALLEHYNTEKDVTGNIFLSQKGSSLRKDAFSDLISKYAKGSGVEKEAGFKITSRTFRHTFITHCIKNNINFKKIAHITGHKDIETLNYYIHLVSKDTEGIASLF